MTPAGVDPDHLVNPIHDLELIAALDPYRDPALVMTVRCGECRNRLGTVAPMAPYFDLPSFVNYQRGTRRQHRPGSATPRPWIEVAFIGEWYEGGKMVIRCHKTCPAHDQPWTIDNRQLVLAFARKAAAGGDELVLGQDV